MIQLQSLAFGPFPEVEVDRDLVEQARRGDREAFAILVHQVSDALYAVAYRILRDTGLAEDALQNALVIAWRRIPHLREPERFEHLTLEILGAFDHARRLSGVTCAYVTPPERNDVFVECTEPETGGFAAMLAVDAMNTALADLPLAPVFPDIVRCTRILRQYVSGAWPVARLAGLAGLTVERTERALDYLTRARLVELEAYAMNFSGERHYRFVGACEAA